MDCLCHPAPDGPKHLKWGVECVLSMYRGLRNGVMAGARIRLPYILNALAYALIFRTPEYDRQLFFHGKNLGQFVAIYKGITCLLRNFGITGGIDSLIAGAIGGWTSFGTTGGVTGAVNEQITLYLFARGLEGLIRSGVKRKILPSAVDIRKPLGFKMLAAFSLAVILYLTEYEPDTLRPSFMGIMTNLYHESNAGPLMPPMQFAPIVLVVLATMVGGLFSSKFSLQAVLDRVIDRKAV